MNFLDYNFTLAPIINKIYNFDYNFYYNFYYNYYYNYYYNKYSYNFESFMYLFIIFLIGFSFVYFVASSFLIICKIVYNLYLTFVNIFTKNSAQLDIDQYIIDSIDSHARNLDSEITTNSNESNNSSYDINDYSKYYSLYIYLDESVRECVKQLYINAAINNNLLLDTYLNIVDTDLNITSSSNNAIVFEDFCFDAGFDIYCPEDIISYGSQSVMVDHKIKCCMKYCDKYVGYYLYSRSSTPVKTPLRLSNCVGVIDSGYRGNIKANFDNIKGYDFMEYQIKKGDRLLQICPPNLEYPMKVLIVDKLEDLGKQTLRGDNGFGSTG
jgi:dUTP pyrophosphatase